MLFHRLAFPPSWQTRSTESQHSASDTNHSSHDDLLSHILACMPVSARQANNVRLHIKTAGSVITFLRVDVLAAGVSLLFPSPPDEQTVWGHRSNLNTAGAVIRLFWFDLLYAGSGLETAFAIHSVALPSPLWVCRLLQICDLWIFDLYLL